VICVYDESYNVIEKHEHKGDFKEPRLIVHGISGETKSRHAVKRDG
jgi:hypothetical protein